MLFEIDRNNVGGKLARTREQIQGYYPGYYLFAAVMTVMAAPIVNTRG